MVTAPQRAHEPAHRPVPAAVPDDPQPWREKLLGTRAAVAHGHTPPAQYRAEINSAGQKRLSVLMSGSGNSPRRYMPEHVARDLGPYQPARAQREAIVAEGIPDPLGARCPHCHAQPDLPCQSGYGRNGKGRRALSGVHPSRIEALIAQLAPTDDEQAEAEQVRLAHLMCQPPAPRETRARRTSWRKPPMTPAARAAIAARLTDALDVHPHLATLAAAELLDRLAIEGWEINATRHARLVAPRARETRDARRLVAHLTRRTRKNGDPNP
ncbi:hypothetical protein [Streptomyces sp. 35G-GA-8]|uniref:zinc finger domain-containing protein n=1 Tax=Streptomyces sp. 35G-GA-8 TaxID=2939434 RepID=UPI00201F59D7|nr:hypothetical protein [Streptomyces sp. 35G-GA-8]MCL7380895.1 hypothetical protein [Streptomyces sp. 35G-GA-8]